MTVSPVAAARPRLHGRLRRPGWTTLLLAAGVAVQLVPLLLGPGALTQDGPAHVGGAWVLLHHGDDDAVGRVLREQFGTDLSPVPNLFTTLALAALIPLLGPDGAERLFVAAFVVALVAALRYALRGVDRGAGVLAAAALPLAGGQLAAYGFYNFCWGVVGALVVLGLALRRGGGWTPRAAAGLSALLVLTWTAHLLPFGVAAAGAGVLGLARARADVRDGLPRAAAARRHVVPVVLAGLPAVALTLVYLGSGSGSAGAPEGGPGVVRTLSVLSGVRPLATGHWPEVLPAVVVTAVLVALAARRAPGSAPRADRTALAGLLLGALAATLLVPERFGPAFGYLPERLAWFPYLLLVLVAATRAAFPRARRTAAVTLVVASVLLVAIRLPGQVTAGREAREVVSVAGAIEPGSTLVVLQYARDARGAGVPDPLRHESSRLAARAGAADVGLYEAMTPYFQVTYDGGPQLARRMAPDPRELEQVPPDVDLAAVRGDLDYVVVVGRDRADAATRDAPVAQAVDRELTEHYTRVAVSAPTGLVEVWHRRTA